MSSDGWYQTHYPGFSYVASLLTLLLNGPLRRLSGSLALVLLASDTSGSVVGQVEYACSYDGFFSLV